MLSIITITRNDALGLKRTIDSADAIRASFSNVEQIVIDGSDLDNLLINEEYCRNKTNVRYLKVKGAGIANAFNYGLANANHQWIWFLNGGDSIYEFLDLSLFHKLLSNIKADILIFQLHLMQKEITVQFPSVHQCFPPVRPWIPHPSSVVAKNVFSRFGPFDESLRIAMDYEYWLRVYGESVVANLISIPITTYDEHGISSTQIAFVSREGKDVLKGKWVKLMRSWLSFGKSIISQYRYFKSKSKYES